MPFVAIGSAKASPGATTLALATALCSNATGPRVVVEADPAGGTLAARAGLGYEPGIMTLAAAFRHGVPHLAALLEFSQGFHTGTGSSADIVDTGSTVAVPCPASSGQAHAALSSAAASIGDTLAAADAFAVVDIGRVNGRSPSLELARRATLTLVLCRPRLDEIQHLPTVVDLLARAGATTELVTVDATPYDPVDVAAHLGIALFGVWVDDRAAAAQFWSSPGPTGRLARSKWFRATADLVSAIDDRVAAGSVDADVRDDFEPQRVV